jgi:hypothetical protein
MAGGKGGEVIATERFTTYDPTDDDRERTVEKGERLPADHPIVAAQPQWFKKAPRRAAA